MIYNNTKTTLLGTNLEKINVLQIKSYIEKIKPLIEMYLKKIFQILMVHFN